MAWTKHRIEQVELGGKWKEITHRSLLVPPSFYLAVGVSFFSMLNRFKMDTDSFNKAILNIQNLLGKAERIVQKTD